MEKDTQPNTWPDLIIGLYDKLSERNAEITYQIENLEIQIPTKNNADTDHAKWKINGTMKISTRNNAH